jgi:hypothetical protein
MHVAATVQDVEYLTRLRHGAKQWIVTARSFLLLVKAIAALQTSMWEYCSLDYKY